MTPPETFIFHLLESTGKDEQICPVLKFSPLQNLTKQQGKNKNIWGLTKRSFTWGDHWENHQKKDFRSPWEKFPRVKTGAEVKFEFPVYSFQQMEVELWSLSQPRLGPLRLMCVAERPPRPAGAPAPDAQQPHAPGPFAP